MIEDSSSIDFQSDLDDGALTFRDDDAEDVEEAQRNDITDFGEEDVLRHIAKRSPIPPFDPISKTLKLKKKIKKLLKKTGKLGGVGLAAGGGGLAASRWSFPLSFRSINGLPFVG